MIKGYPISTGYCGWVDGKFLEFETEEAYLEVIREEEDPDD